MRTLNSFLATTLETLNGLLALLFIFIGAIVFVIGIATDSISAIMIGGLIGIVLPGIICGPIAILVDIRNILRR